VTTYKTITGTHQGEFLGIPATGKRVSFYTVDAMRVVDARSLSTGVSPRCRPDAQLGVVPPLDVSDDDTDPRTVAGETAARAV